MARYELYDQDQQFFITIDQETNYPPGSYPRFLNDFIERQVDLAPFSAKRKNDEYGALAKHAKMMLKVIFYAFSLGIYSMREIAGRFLRAHVDFIYLAGYCTADHSTFSRFINMYREEIIAIFTKTLYVAHNMRYVSKELIAIDGTKIKANASKQFSGTPATFAKKKKSYEKMIGNLMDRASRVRDREERGQITAENAIKENERIERVKNSYENAIERIDAFLSECLETEKQEQVNLIDPDSKIMEKDHKYFQGYNCQAATSEHGIIVANEVINIATDRTSTEMMVRKTSAALMDAGFSENEAKAIPYVLDKGYHNSESIGNLMRDDYNILIPSFERGSAEESERIQSHHCTLRKEGDQCILECPGGLVVRSKGVVKQRNQYTHRFLVYRSQCGECRYRSKCMDLMRKDKKFEVKREVFENLSELNRLKERMTRPEERDIYNKRMGTVEPVFGTIKSARSFDTFLVRGLKKVKQRWSMLCTTFNLKRLYTLSS
jgi:transposase